MVHQLCHQAACVRRPLRALHGPARPPRCPHRGQLVRQPRPAGSRRRRLGRRARRRKHSLHTHAHTHARTPTRSRTRRGAGARGRARARVGRRCRGCVQRRRQREAVLRLQQLLLVQHHRLGAGVGRGLQRAHNLQPARRARGGRRGSGSDWDRRIFEQQARQAPKKPQLCSKSRRCRERRDANPASPPGSSPIRPPRPGRSPPGYPSPSPLLPRRRNARALDPKTRMRCHLPVSWQRPWL